jgi:hypothetical protein
MPLDKQEILGTEKDGSPSHEYCKYCYQAGAFTSPDMTIDGMRTIVKTEMAKQHIPQNVIDMAVNILPSLKRWKK